MPFTKLINYEAVIKKLGVNEVSGGSRLIGSITQHLFWLKIRSTVFILLFSFRKPACPSGEKVILPEEEEKQNIKAKAGKQRLEGIKRNGQQANVTKTVPRTDEKELEGSRRGERMAPKMAPICPMSRTKPSVRGTSHSTRTSSGAKSKPWWQISSRL